MTNSKAWRSRASITPMVCLTLSLAAAHVQASAVTLKFAPGDQLNLAISNTNPNMIIVSIHRNSIDTGKMRRSSLDPTFLLA